MLPIDFNGLDTAVHGPIRLGVLSALQIDGPLDGGIESVEVNRQHGWKPSGKPPGWSSPLTAKTYGGCSVVA